MFRGADTRNANTPWPDLSVTPHGREGVVTVPLMNVGLEGVNRVRLLSHWEAVGRKEFLTFQARLGRRRF